MPLSANPLTRLSAHGTNSSSSQVSPLMSPLPGTPIVESYGQLAFPASTSQNHWWLLDFWDSSSSGGSLPSDLSGQFVAVANTIGGLQSGDGILYLPINVAYGTSPSNCVWFQFDVYFDSSGHVNWYIWDVNCPGTNTLGDYHYTPIGLTYTIGDHYSFALTTSSSNIVTFAVNDTSTGSHWSNNRWFWIIPSTTMLATEGTFSPASAVEGYTTNSSLSGVPLFQTRIGDGIMTNRNYEAGTGLPAGIATSRSSLGDSSHYLWSMGSAFCGPVNGPNSLNCNGLTPTSIELNWGVSGYLFLSKYLVKESTTGAGGPWTTIDTITSKSNTTRYITGLAPNSTYWWQVEDVDCCGATATTNVLQITQPTAASLNYTPLSDTTYQLNWNNNGEYTQSVVFQSYQIEESVNGGSYSVISTTNGVNDTSSPRDLSPDTEYSFFIITTDNCATCTSGHTSRSTSDTIAFRTPQTLVALASSQTGSFDAGQPVTFTCSAAGGVSPYNYAWAFGDGLTGSGQSSSHSYSSAGSKRVVCTVTDTRNTSVPGLTSTFILTDPTVTTPTPSHTSIDIGQTVNLVAQPNGGSGGYSFAWLNLPLGCASSNLASISCTPSSIGPSSIVVNVTDSNGFSVLSSQLSFIVYSDPTISAASSNPTNIDLRQTSSLAISGTGGYGMFSYSYSGLPSGCISENTPNLSCTPLLSGTYYVTVALSDQNGFSVTSNQIPIVVNPAPTSNLSVSPAVTDVDQQVTLTISAAQGTGHFSYSFQGLPLGCFTSNSTQIYCIPLIIGSYTIVTTTTDSVGGMTSSTANLKVNADPTIVSFISLPQSATVNLETTIRVSVNGGTEPFAYEYSGLPPGCNSADSPTITCTPATTGTYIVQVTVTDQSGKTITSLMGLNVAQQNLVLGLAPVEGYSIVGGIVLVGLIGAALALLRVRRTKKKN